MHGHTVPLEGQKVPQRLLVRRDSGRSVPYQRAGPGWKVRSEDGSQHVLVQYDHSPSWMRNGDGDGLRAGQNRTALDDQGEDDLQL
jgi:hypothetical protein